LRSNQESRGDLPLELMSAGVTLDLPDTSRGDGSPFDLDQDHSAPGDKEEVGTAVPAQNNLALRAFESRIDQFGVMEEKIFDRAFQAGALERLKTG
jgi:hypothetical protein